MKRSKRLLGLRIPVSPVGWRHPPSRPASLRGRVRAAALLLAVVLVAAVPAAVAVLPGMGTSFASDGVRPAAAAPAVSIPGGDDVAGESAAGESVAGESVAGGSVAGESAAGESAPADSAGSAVPAEEEGLPGRHSAIQVGERLTFTVRYGLIKAGTAVMAVEGIRRFGQRPVYHIVSTAESNSVFDGIYRVRDRVLSLVDVDHLHSYFFEKHLREGKYRADHQARFDPERGVVTYHDGGTTTFTPPVYDVLAAFYRVRTMPLEPGRRFYLTSHENRKEYPLRVSVIGRERVETPAGTFDCIVLEPTLRSGAFFKNEGRLSIWLTDDERRMPVLMRSKLPIGAISVELIAFERPSGGGAEDADGGAGGAIPADAHSRPDSAGADRAPAARP